MNEPVRRLSVVTLVMFLALMIAASWTQVIQAGSLNSDSRNVRTLYREFGDFPLGKHVAGWEWFAIQLDDSREMLVYRLHDGDGHARADTESYLYEADGTALEIANIKLEATDWWESGATGVRRVLRTDATRRDAVRSGSYRRGRRRR